MRKPARAAWSRAALACLLLASTPAAAGELWSDGTRSLELRGSVRQIVSHGKGTDASRFEDALSRDPSCILALTFPDCSAFDEVGEKTTTVGLTRLRLRFDAVLGRGWSARLDWDNELALGSLNTLFGEAGPRDTFFGWEEEVHAFGLSSARDHRRLTTRIYRGFVNYDGEHLQLRFGRQRLAWGTGRIWNPTDRLSFVPPLSIEADQSLGVDAVDARYRLSGFSFLQAVYAPGTSSSESRSALRFQGVIGDVDVSALVGRFEEALVVGFDLAANLGDAAVRLEAAWTDPTQETWPIGASEPAAPDDFLQLVVSADINYDIGTGLYVLAEHLYNGNALGFGRGKAGSLLPFFESTDVPPSPEAAVLPGPFATVAGTEIFGSSQVISGSEHLTAVQLSYEPTAALRTDILLIYDWDGDSAAFFPQLAFTGFDAFEISLGAQLFAGPRLSEYGDREPFVFLLAEYFF